MLRDHVGEKRDAFAVAAGVRTLGIHHLGEGGRDVVEIVLVYRHARLLRRLGQGRLMPVVSAKHVPERRPRRDALKGRYQVRIEPGPRPVLGFAQRRLGAVRDVEHVDHLCHQRDAGINRDGRAAQTQRLTAAIPMLIEIFDAVGDRLGETHFAGDVGAAMAACLYQLAGDLAAVLEDVDDRAEPFGEAGFQAGMAQHEAQRLRQAAVDELEVLFEGEIIGQIQLADPRRVAAAAEILQQQRVIEFGDLVLAEADFPADFDADTAAPHTMSRRLSLREIERVAECA